jgi:hypothetical protein
MREHALIAQLFVLLTNNPYATTFLFSAGLAALYAGAIYDPVESLNSWTCDACLLLPPSKRLPEVNVVERGNLKSVHMVGLTRRLCECLYHTGVCQLVPDAHATLTLYSIP